MILQDITVKYGNTTTREVPIPIPLLVGAVILSFASIAIGDYLTYHYPTHPAVFTPNIKPQMCKPPKKKALLVGITYSGGQAAYLRKIPTAYARQLRSALVNTGTIHL